MTDQVFTRRSLLRGGGLLMLATATGCSFFDTDPNTGTAGAAQAADLSAKEAPALAELVKAGKLPPLEQRLPKNPWPSPRCRSPAGTAARGAPLWSARTTGTG
ncbi:hypothetical protein ACFQQB_41325 [Nonomuraea rubra]|uniref:hypothetical protein n=1 Tax=Nonomuraea rubra TaxID=46180 RepID=UPI0036238D52